jgi:hypothetical protein
MDMQDKEIDQLFRSKLEDLELEPSVSVWEGVNESFGNKRRKKILPFLSIAASIIVLIAAGILFIPKKESIIKLHGKDRAVIIKPSKVTVPAAVKQPLNITSGTAVIATTQLVHLYHKTNNNIQIATATQHITTKNNLPVPANNQQILAASSSKTEVKQIDATDSSTTLAAIKTPTQPIVTLAAVPGKQPAALPQTEKIVAASIIKKHGIHGLGDILNVVVAVVDKRKDKIIEFADSDGDGASITAVNLGPIKVKKEN